MSRCYLYISILLISLLSGCASLIVEGVCQSNKKQEDLSVKKYKYHIDMDTVNGQISKEGVLSCKPERFNCYGGEWYPFYSKRSKRGINLQIDNIRHLELALPSCSHLHRKHNFEYSELEKLPISYFVYDRDEYVLPIDEITNKSALNIFGIRLNSYKIKRLKE